MNDKVNTLESKLETKLDIFPNAFPEYEQERMLNIISFEDNTQILKSRIHEFSATLALANYACKQLDKDISKIQFFEAGNCPYGSINTTNVLKNGGTAFFFANHPKFLNYKGYDPVSPKNIFSEDSSIKLKKSNDTKTKINNRYLKNQITTYEEFEVKTQKFEDKIIFSNHVLGDPNIKPKPFWKLPGIHIHTLLAVDMERNWLKKHYPAQYNVTMDSNQGRIAICETEETDKLYLSKNKNIPGIINIKNLCIDLLDIPLNSKAYELNMDQAIIAYKI